MTESAQTQPPVYLADSSTHGGTTGTVHSGYVIAWVTNTASIPDTAIHFNGVGTYIDTSNSVLFNFTTNLFTVNFWARPMTANGNLMENGIPDQNGWYVHVGGSYEVYFGTETNGSDFGIVTSPGAAQVNAWTMVTIVRTGPTDALIYINGIQTATSGSITSPASSTDSLIIGADRAGAHYLDGDIWLPQIWGEALPPTAVANLYFMQSQGYPWPVSGESGGVVPTGTVAFFDGSSSLGTGTLNSLDVATVTTTVLSTAASPHSITAVYSGDSTFPTSTSSTLSQVITNSITTTNTNTNSTSGAVAIALVNPSFESPAGSQASVAGKPDGWVATNHDTYGVYNPGAGGYTNQVNDILPSPAQGSQVLWMNAGNRVSQLLTNTLAANQTYTLSGAIGNRADGYSILPTDQEYVNLMAGGAIISQNANLPHPGPGGFLPWTISYTTPASGFPSGPLQILLGQVGAGQVNFDNISLTVAPAGAPATNTSSTTTLASSQNPAPDSTLVTFTATISSSGGVPTGTVAFYDGGNSLGFETVNASGIAALGTSALSSAASPHSITAVYSGDSAFAGSTSSVLYQVTTNAGVSTNTNSNPGAAVSIALANPSFESPAGAQGSVAGKPDGWVASNQDPYGVYNPAPGVYISEINDILPSPAQGSQVLWMNAGNYLAQFLTNTLAANQTYTLSGAIGNRGDGYGMLPADQEYVALLAGSTIIAQNTNLPHPGPGGFLPWSVSYTSPASGFPSGPLQIRLGQAGVGEVNFDNISLTVSAAGTAATIPSTTTVTSSQNPAVAGSLVTFTATVSGSGGVPTGIVTFYDAGSNLGIETLNSSALAALGTSSLSSAASPHSITAVYSGDSTFAGSTSSVLSQVITNANASTNTNSNLGTTVPIVLVNPSFESPAGVQGTVAGKPDGWVASNQDPYGVYNPAPGVYTNEVNDILPSPAQGSQVLWINAGNYLAQFLTNTLAASQTYTLSGAIGNRGDGYGMLPTDREYGNLLAGTTIIAQNTNLPHPGPGGFLPWTISYTSPASGVPAGPLQIRLGQDGTGEVNFDNITLTASPSGP
jgi:hypothetical protein